jgi:purine-nucleoside phosphorylase
VTNERKQVIEATRFIQSQIKTSPLIGLVSGTGLAEIAEIFSPTHSLSYETIPHFSTSTVTGHSGRLFIGKLQDTGIIAMQGRFHLYEGYSPLQVTFPIRVMQELGVRLLILSNAAGGLTPTFNNGDIMVITDHINLTGANPLCGPNEDTWGIRFPDMSCAYDSELSTLAQETGKKIDIPVQRGVYAGLRGPSLETPAEVRFLKSIGADAVGFSTVQEVIVAVHAKMRVLGLSMITNVHYPDQPEKATIEKVLSVARTTAPKMTAIIRHLLEKLNENKVD